MALKSPPHSDCAEIPNTKMLAISINVAKPKHLVAMVIKINSYFCQQYMMNDFITIEELENRLYRRMHGDMN
jgi:hypothetical protein